jgi:hypothetical protein
VAVGVCALAWGAVDALAGEPPTEPEPASEAVPTNPPASEPAPAEPKPPLAPGVGPTDPDEQFMLGLGYALGRDGHRKNPRRAMKWFRKAAAQGHPRAQTQLGMAYLLGRGVQKDVDQAVVWLRKAAEQGHPKAQLELGIAYRDGLGVAPDPVLSHMWIYLSARSGGLAGRFVLQSSARRLTPEQRQEAMKLALAWLDEHPPPVARTEGEGAEAKTAGPPESSDPPLPAGSGPAPGSSSDPG